MHQLEYLVFSLYISKEYDYDQFVSFLERITHYCINNFEEIVSFAIDKNKCLENTIAMLKENLNKHNIEIEWILLMLHYVNDEELFRKYAYEYEPISLTIFNNYYEYMKNNNKDVSKIIFDSLKLFPIDDKVESYAKSAVLLDDSNEDYKIALYNSNSKNINNFFELYRINDLEKILKIIKSDFHLALATLDLKYVNKLDMGEILDLLELLSKEYIKLNKYEERTLDNIKLWLSSVVVEDNYVSNLCDYALEKLNQTANRILTNKQSWDYGVLARYTCRLNRFISGIIYDYSKKYYRYRNFIKELDYYSKLSSD